MSRSDKTSRLSAEPFDANDERSVRKGLVRRGNEWFHLSQRNATIKLRRLLDDALEDLPALRIDEIAGRSELARFAGADFFAGWSIADAMTGRDQILGADLSALPRRLEQGAARIVPITKLRHFYETLRTFGNDGVWRELLSSCLRHPADLAALFAQSHAHFSIYDNSDQDFGDLYGDRDARFEGTDDREQFATRLVCALLTSRSWSDDAELAFDYVSREVSPIRTQRGRYDDGRSARSSGAGGMDLLLRSRDRGLPIIGEIKARDDTNLFLALVQSLTYACEMATRSQRIRLARPPYNFSRESIEGRGPHLDIYLMYEDGTDASIKRDTMELADRLLCQGSGIAYVVRKIAFLRCSPAGGVVEMKREHLTAIGPG